MNSLIASAMTAIEGDGQLRSLRPISMLDGGKLQQGHCEYTDFSSNDYLGLSRHPLLAKRAADYTREMGAGAGASRLVTGTSETHLKVEQKIAAFKGTEAALLFASGWQANAAVIPALLKAAPGAAVFTDRLVHASVHQGCRAAGVRQIRFAHNDLDHLERLLHKQGREAPARIVLTESVFSMDGDRADLVRLSELARAYDAMLFVDEAHATGVLGPGGAGLSAAIHGGVDIAMGTFSKAMGGFGAYIACSALLRDYLINTCSGFIYSTALPPAGLGAIDASLDLVPGMDAQRLKLIKLAERLRDGIQALGMDTGNSSTQIVPAIVGASAEALALSEHLARNGMFAAAIRPPTVPAGSSRLRLVVRSAHEPEDIDRLIAVLGERR